MDNKSLASFKIKLLYPNIPVNKCIKHLEIHCNKHYITLKFAHYA